jgi:hypothetical protein
MRDLFDSFVWIIRYTTGAMSITIAEKRKVTIFSGPDQVLFGLYIFLYTSIYN